MRATRSYWGGERSHRVDDTEEPLGERDYILTTPRSHSGDALIGAIARLTLYRVYLLYIYIYIYIYIAFISFIAFVGDRRLYFGVYRVYRVTRPNIDVPRPNIDAPVDIISRHLDSIKASPAPWLLVELIRGSFTMRALPAPRGSSS